MTASTPTTAPLAANTPAAAALLEVEAGAAEEEAEELFPVGVVNSVVEARILVILVEALYPKLEW